jgi:hypothetical protein
MESRKNLWWLALALVVLLGGIFGCSGILQELQRADGQTERLRVSGAESWKSWDRNATRPDEGAVILKKEQTF